MPLLIKFSLAYNIIAKPTEKGLNVHKKGSEKDGLAVSAICIISIDFHRRMPLFHTDHEPHESPPIDKFEDSQLNRNQFQRFLTESYIFVVISSNS